MMKVLHLCTKVPFPAKDGGALAVMAFAGIYRTCGASVTILSANTPKHFAADVPDIHGISVRHAPADTRIRFSGFIKNLLFSSLPYQVFRFRDKRYTHALTRLLQSNKFDIVQLEGAHMGVHLAEIRKHSSARVFLRAHNVEHVLWEQITGRMRFSLKKIYLRLMVNRFRKFEQKLIRDVDAVIPISEHDSRVLQKFYPASMLVIPFGIDAGEYLPCSSPREQLSVFFIGALDWIPNQEGILWFVDQVFPLILRKEPEASLHVAGRNAPEWLKNRLMHENVYFYGEIDNARDFMCRYSVMIIPLFSGSGIRVKVLEAMALENAIVTTTRGAEGISAQNGTAWMIADNAADFSDAVLQLLLDNEKCKALGESAREFISKEFDNLVLANKVKDFCRKVLPE